MSLTYLFRWHLSRIVTSLMLCCICASSYATTIVLDNQDDPGEGLNDTTPAAPVGGNNGTTVGEQRTIVFEYASQLLEGVIDASIPIVIAAQFNPLSCSTGSGTIGSAGANGWYVNPPGAPISNTYYPIALANSFAGSDLNSTAAEISATFNSDVGTPGCLTSKSYYLSLIHI